MADHFQGKSVLSHLADVRSSQEALSVEAHGIEMPGLLLAFFDSLRNATVAYLLLFIILDGCGLPFVNSCLSFAIGWVFWSGARSTLLAWYRLNRLHAIASQERAEIDTNRSQEREELVALYTLKGFSGQLLDKVVDVLMADKDRLLKVMLQEEMGFRLEEHPHPFFHGCCAALGAGAAALLVFLAYVGCSLSALMVSAVVLIALIGMIFAKFEQTLMIPAFIWNLSIASVIVVLTKMCLKLFAGCS